jgi:hypothetical protein
MTKYVDLDLEENKIVSDDGVSEVEGPTTPAGGLPKKAKADLKKAVDPKADKITESEDEDEDDEDEIDESFKPGDKVSYEDEYGKRITGSYMKELGKNKGHIKIAGGTDVNMHHSRLRKESYDMKESFESLFEDMDINEEFKDKLSLVFEAAVNEAASDKAHDIAEALEEEFESRLTESVNEAMEDIVENLDSYLDYVVTEWLKENEVAIESGIKVEMAESFMNGLKELFYEHNVEIDEETIDVVSDLEEKISESSENINMLINENIALAEEIKSLRAEQAFGEICEGLTTSQIERMRVLSEKIDHDDIDSYKEDLSTIRESFFKKARAIVEEVDEEQEIITEETTKKRVSDYDSVNAIVAAINARNLR